MELEFLTPTEIWEGFNPWIAPLEHSIISAETEDNLICAKQYFTVEETAYGKIRAYLEVYYDGRWADARAALLLLPASNRRNNHDVVASLVKDGYVVCVLDYCGGILDDQNKTTFPENLSFAAHPEFKKHLNSVADNARNTPWFVWSKIARRALTLLEQQNIIDRMRIGIVGIGEGAHVAWQVAGTDPRIHALVAVNGGGYRWAEGKSKFIEGNVLSNDADRVFSMGVGAETYAKFVQCPTLMIVSRATHATDVDRADDVLSTVKSDKKQLLICGGTDKQITQKAFGVMRYWLREFFVQNGDAVQKPTMSFENVDGKLYLKLQSAEEVEKISVYVSYNEPLSSARHWDSLGDLQKVDEDAYTVSIPVYDIDELVAAYATFTYPSGNCISTPIQAIVPTKLNIREADGIRESSNIIYEGSRGLHGFACLTKDAIIDESLLVQENGPFNITGITVKKGGMYLYRSAAEIASLSRTTMLHFDAYSKEERSLRISMFTYPEMDKYTATVDLKGGEFWQKVLLQSADFKTDEGKTLSKFGDTKILSIKDAAGVIFNNFLWI